MNKRTILVTGDYALDHHIYEGKRGHFCDRTVGVRKVTEPGGAALVHRLIEKLIPSDGSIELVAGAPQAGAAKEADVPEACQAYAVWTPSKGPKKGDVWRVADAMGFGGDCSRGVREDGAPWPSYTEPDRDVDCVVLCDGGLGFRDLPSAWPLRALERARLIVLKTAAPFQGNPLWRHLKSAGLLGKTVVVVASSELRKADARIGLGLSWEDTLETLVGELAGPGELQELCCCRHVIVCFESEAGLWIDQPPAAQGKEGHAGRALCHFVYRAACIEGDQRRSMPGGAFGFLSCLTAAVAWRLVCDADKAETDLERALEGGLSAVGRLIESGHGPSDRMPTGFPAGTLAEAVRAVTSSYSRAVFSMDEVRSGLTCPAGSQQAAKKPSTGCWSLLRNALQGGGAKCQDPAYDLAKRVIEDGRIAIESVPHLTVGNLTSVDRREIEGMRVISRLIQDYRSQGDAKKPLSIGVFGAPGSGKSFAVKEIAFSLLDKKGWKEFNLSQFATAGDLIGAFHQIRDVRLTGALPVVFFDEFDAQGYKWLQYLLAPMQDGAFQEGQITHPLGACVLFFAGGTSWTYEAFGPPRPASGAALSDAYRDFVLAKGPDFKSRLDGFLNVNGANQRTLPEARDEGDLDPCDVFFPIRRAFIVRGELQCDPHQKLDFDEGVLNALVGVERYTHGARSLGKIVEPFKRAFKAVPTQRLYRSWLPPRELIALHTSAQTPDRAFLKLCEGGDLSQHRPEAFADHAQLEVAAAAIHDTYERLGVEDGWRKPGEVKAYRDIEAFLKGSNRAAAQRMPGVLRLASLAIEPGANTSEEKERVRRRLEYYLELLAEREHIGWMAWHVEQGWVLGGEKNPDNKTHPCLKPYRDLSEEDRNKDRNTIRHYLAFAEKAGMKIVDA